ncbi:nicotinamide riboside transporter PnuC [Pseudomonas nitroreducens]|uniref:nicotinamide riboside transporter PnuC n=1 Tax=Pseudomonas TaxID=286 RepID=UPI0007EE8367|nr:MULTISPECIES: nicotinamide riboside transporter PnuC [Pseudomonas]MDG9853915.1 nicotinamide riboside transporter PnuC [Pseudomonas nitroreducens]MDH1072750.1 nicotinamide riboside transporter PnuC [Pseudomonas nitroreducens]NMZ72368.1 nicotinamide mononucleotide transporter [Pseudomonas nitroreducens]OBY57463.1 aminotransferase [Pseudomonas sp. AU12215]
MSTLEIVAVIVNVLGVWLTARRIRWCWPVNVVAVLLYAWIFFSVKLYSDMLLQLVFVVLQFYGWWQWSKGGSDHGKVRVERLPPSTAITSCLAGAVGAFALGWAMHTHTDAALPWMDAALTAFSLVASFWAARKYVASWWLWIILDVLYTGVFLYKALYLTAGLYAGFVVLAIYGLLAWQRELHDEPPSAPALAGNS